MEVENFLSVVGFAETNLDDLAFVGGVNDGQQGLFVALNSEVRENQHFTGTVSTQVNCLSRASTKRCQYCRGQNFLFHLHLMKLLIN